MLLHDRGELDVQIRPLKNPMDSVVHFRPSRVEGVAEVDEVRVYRNRVEIHAAREWRSHSFMEFAPGREIASGEVPVGELHFSKENYADSHVIFYTSPRIAIYMPADGPTAYPDSVFWRVQKILKSDGFKLYEDTPRHLTVFDPRLMRTILYLTIGIALAWLIGLSGYLPGEAGQTMRRLLLANPRNPSIGLALILPAIVVPILLASRHGKNPRSIAGIIAVSYLIALASDWAMRHAIASWARLEEPPFQLEFWSIRRFIGTLIVVAIVSMIAAAWRRGFLEPIPKSITATDIRT